MSMCFGTIIRFRRAILGIHDAIKTSPFWVIYDPVLKSYRHASSLRPEELPRSACLGFLRLSTHYLPFCPEQWETCEGLLAQNKFQALCGWTCNLHQVNIWAINTIFASLKILQKFAFVNDFVRLTNWHSGLVTFVFHAHQLHIANLVFLTMASLMISEAWRYSRNGQWWMNQAFSTFFGYLSSKSWAWL